MKVIIVFAAIITSLCVNTARAGYDIKIDSTLQKALQRLAKEAVIIDAESTGKIPLTTTAPLTHKPSSEPSGTVSSCREDKGGDPSSSYLKADGSVWFHTETISETSMLNLWTRQADYPFKIKSQAELNAFVAKTGYKLYCQLNESSFWTMPDLKSDLLPTTKSKYWTTHKRHYGKRGTVDADVFFFELNTSLLKAKDFSASEALDELGRCGTVAGCQITMEYVALHCIKAFLGDKKFDSFVSSLMSKGKKFQIGYSEMNSVLGETLIKRSEATPPKPGFFGYIPNVPEFSIVEPLHSSQGQNGLWVTREGDDKKALIGAGSFFDGRPKTHTEIISKYQKILQKTTSVIPKRVDYKAVVLMLLKLYADDTEALEAKIKESKEMAKYELSLLSFYGHV